MALASFAEKPILTKKIDFSKISYKNVQHFDLMHAHKPKFGLFPFKLITSQVVQRARALRTRICVLGSKMVNAIEGWKNHVGSL